MRSLLISGKWNKVQGSWVSSSTLGRQRCICAETSTRDTMLEHVPALCMVQREHASLFGSPIGTLEGIQDTIPTKKTLEVLGDRLRRLHPHDALCLLWHTFVIPKTPLCHSHLTMLPLPRTTEL